MLNNRVLTYSLLIIAVMLISPLTAYCASDKSATTEKTSSSTSMANPAAVKCLNDGFVLVPVKKDGSTRFHICENPENGKKCEVWKYFKGECHLK